MPTKHFFLSAIFSLFFITNTFAKLPTWLKRHHYDLQFVKVKNSAPVEEHHSITKKNSKIDSTTFAITKNEIVVAPISIQQNTIEINPVESIVKNDVNTTIPTDLKLSKHIFF